MYVDRYRFPVPETLPGPMRMLRNAVHQSRYTGRQLRSVMSAYRAFEDAESRRLFRQLLLYRISPSLSSVARNAGMHRDIEAVMASETVPSEPGPYDDGVDPYRVWSTAYRGTPLQVTTSKYGLYWVVSSSQYHFSRGGVTVEPAPGDVVIDGGAFIGETALQFAVDVGPSGRVLSFEPFAHHVALAENYNKRLNPDLASRIEFFPAGLSDHGSTTLAALPAARAFEPGADLDAGRRLEMSDAAVTIDDVVAQKKLDRVGFIKMDIEGSERAALEGAARTIATFRPKLAICVYHKPDDLWALPNYIKSRYPFYRLFLDHHSLHREETVLYALPHT